MFLKKFFNNLLKFFKNKRTLTKDEQIELDRKLEEALKNAGIL